MAKKYDNEDGVWRTIGGRRIFIKNGQDLASAMRESGKFKSASKGTAKKESTQSVTDEELKAKYDELRKDRKGLVYNLEEGYLKDLSNEEKLAKLNKELDDINNQKENIKKIDKEAMDYQREKHGEKGVEEYKKYMGQGDDTLKKATGGKKLEAYRVNEDGKKEMYERTLGDDERGYWTKENGQRVFKENPNYKGEKNKEAFEKMGYTAPTKENIDKANTNARQRAEERKNEEDFQKWRKNNDPKGEWADEKAREIYENTKPVKYDIKTKSYEEVSKEDYKEKITNAREEIAERRKTFSNKEDSKKMTAPLGKEDDIGKTPYEKGEKYRNSIIETAKNSKEDNVTLDTETGKVATFDKGYSVSFQQSSDNYDDKEYYEKVEECRNKCDGKLYAGKYGGDAEASFHTDDIETAKELMYKYNQESIYDWEHETLIMNDKYDSSSNKTNYEAEKSTNDIMNEKIRSRGKAEDDLPKHVEIKSQGTSNRKEVSENIQAHILEHYDSPEDFIEQMDAYDWKPTMWHRGEALAEDGFYEIYYEDQRKFLDGLKINPKGKNFSDDRVFQTYKSLIGRESAKLYDRIQKNSYKKYMKAHPLSKMSFEEFKNMRGGK